MFQSKLIFTTSDFFNAIINQISYRPKICYIFVKHWQFVKERFFADFELSTTVSVFSLTSSSVYWNVTVSRWKSLFLKPVQVPRLPFVQEYWVSSCFKSWRTQHLISNGKLDNFFLAKIQSTWFVRKLLALKKLKNFNYTSLN